MGLLPCTTSDDTTGAGDEYAPDSCAAGTWYANTGQGEDLVYLIATDLTCELLAVMAPIDLSTPDDLALYVIAAEMVPEGRHGRYEVVFGAVSMVVEEADVCLNAQP